MCRVPTMYPSSRSSFSRTSSTSMSSRPMRSSSSSILTACRDSEGSASVTKPLSSKSPTERRPAAARAASSSVDAWMTTGSFAVRTNADLVENLEPESGTLNAPCTWPATKSGVRRTSRTVAPSVDAAGSSGGCFATNGPRLSSTIRSMFGGRGQVGAGCVADQQRVAGDQEPRLVATRAVEDLEAAVLRPVAGRVDDADRRVAEGELLSVLERVEVVCRLGRRVDGDGRAVLQREPAVPGDVVGVRVRLEDANDVRPARLRLVEVLLDRVGGIDDHRLPGGLIADQVGRAAEIVVDELAKEHWKRA